MAQAVTFESETYACRFSKPLCALCSSKMGAGHHVRAEQDRPHEPGPGCTDFSTTARLAMEAARKNTW